MTFDEYADRAREFFEDAQADTRRADTSAEDVQTSALLSIAASNLAGLEAWRHSFELMQRQQRETAPTVLRVWAIEQTIKIAGLHAL